ncbi:MAG TPA: aminoglycoside phosphotransferase family protein [Acidimicrobiia bacterium]
MATNMPTAEVEVTTGIVRSLLRSQRPDLAHLEVRVLANGWDNSSFRVGVELVARFPRRAIAAGLIENEARWLPELAPHLTLPVPAPLFLGRPEAGYPWRWALAPYISGDAVAGLEDLDLPQAAEDLGQFLRSLHSPAPPDAPENPYRGIPLALRDRATRERIDQLDPTVDPRSLLGIWDAAMTVPEFDDQPVWLHGDLHPNNMLASGGNITGIVDFGDITSGDPATDLSVAWMLFPADIHPRFRAAYGEVEDETWERARGWALSLAVSYLAHSADNPTMGRIGSKTIDRLLPGV